jgi:uncharacterized lipoprotein YmbA
VRHAPPRHADVGRSLILLLGLSLTGCGSSPSTTFFALEPVPPHGAPAPVTGPPVSVDAVRLPPVLDRLELVQLGTADEVDIRQERRWAAPLDRMSREVLARDLAERLPAGMVIAPDAPKPNGPVRGVTVDLEAFAPDSSGRVVLDGEWALATGNPPEVREREHAHIEAGGTGENQASAMSDALAQLADGIAARLARPAVSQGCRGCKSDGR